MITPHPTTSTWRQLIRDLLEYGDVVSPNSTGANWRGRTTFELLAHRSVVPMSSPVVLSPARKLGFRFMVAEAAWIASGDNRLATIAPYAPIMKNFSDDGVRLFGSYGVKFVDQLSFAVRALAADPASRQAVVNIWREQPPATKDTPCTLSWQYLIRDGRLHCVATMRSSDVWTGWVYDVFNFSVCAAVVALELRAFLDPSTPGVTDSLRVRPFADLALGNLYLTAGSQHLYRVDEAVARTSAAAEADESGGVAPLDLSEFATGEELVAHLWALARGWETPKAWLGDLPWRR